MITLDQHSLQEALCRSLCTSVQVGPASGGRMRVSTPFLFPDGDPYELYVEPLPLGGVRVTDVGLTLMHLSYSMDIESLMEGTRRRVLDASLSANQVSMSGSGHLSIEGTVDEIGALTFRLGQAIASVLSVSFLQRVRNESSFYADLRATVDSIVPGAATPNYLVPELGERAVDYPVDFFIKTKRLPLFLFGVPTRDKARLVTITLRALDASNVKYDSLIVFQRQEELAPSDVARLSDIGGEMISSLSAQQDLRRKIERKLAA